MESDQRKETKPAIQANPNRDEDRINSSLSMDLPLATWSNVNTQQTDIFLHDSASTRRRSSSKLKVTRHMPRRGCCSEHGQEPSREHGSGECTTTLTTTRDPQLEGSAVQRPHLSRAGSSEETCRPPNPTPSTLRPRQKQPEFTPYWEKDLKDDGIQLWLSGISGHASASSLEKARFDRLRSQHIKSESMVADSHHAALNNLARIAAAHLLQDQVNVSAADFAPFNPEEYALESSDVSWVHFYRSIAPMLTSSRETAKDKSQHGPALLGRPTTSHAKSQPGLSQSRFSAGLDGPNSPTANESGIQPTSAILQLVVPHNTSAEVSRSRLNGPAVSGTIGCEQSWVKRKPRRVHNVSEVSVPDPAVHKHAVDLFSMTSFDEEDSIDEEGKEALCLDLAEHDAQFHILQTLALRSCPELHRIGEDKDRTTVMKVGSSQCRESLKQPRHPVMDAMSKRLRSLSRKFWRSSSNYSIRSDFPVPPDGKERRLLAQGSAEIYPSSEDETPVFNSPVSNTPARSPGSKVDLLARSGTTSGSNEVAQLPTTSKQRRMSVGPSVSPQHIPPTTSATSAQAPTTTAASGTHSPTSSSPIGSLVLTIPPPSTTSLPAPSPSITPLRRGQKRRAAARSRLSEVTTPDDMATIGPVCPLPMDNFDESAIDDTEDDDPYDMYPRPLTVSRPSIPGHRRSMGVVQTSGDSSPISLEEATRLSKAGMIFELGSFMDSMAHEEFTVGVRSSSVGKTSLGQTRDANQSSSAQSQGGLSGPLDTGPFLMSGSNFSGHLAMSEPTIIKPSFDHHLDTDASTHGRVRSPSESTNPLIPSQYSGADSMRTSCHPDTWTDSQGEPGDSEPFCPPKCDARHSHEVIPTNGRPVRIFKQSTSGTVLVLDRVESGGSDDSLGMLSTTSEEDQVGCGRTCVLED